MSIESDAASRIGRTSIDNRRGWLGILLTGLLCLALGWVANDKFGSRYVLHVPDVGRYRIDSHSGKTWRLEEKERRTVNELPPKKPTPLLDAYFEQWKKEHPESSDSSTAVAEPRRISKDSLFQQYYDATHPSGIPVTERESNDIWDHFMKTGNFKKDDDSSSRSMTATEEPKPEETKPWAVWVLIPEQREDD